MTEPAVQPPSAPPAWQPPAWQPPPDAGGVDWRGAAGPLPGSIVAAAVVLLVMAVLSLLLAVIVLFSSSVVADPAFTDAILTDPTFQRQSPEAAMAMAQGFLYVFAGILLAVAVGHLLAGIGILRRRNWARILGMVLAGLGVVLTGASAAISLLTAGQPLPPGIQEISGVSPAQYQEMMTGGLIFGVAVSMVLLVAYGYVFFLLLARGAAFNPPERI